MEVIISTIARLHVSPQLKDYAFQYDELLATMITLEVGGHNADL